MLPDLGELLSWARIVAMSSSHSSREVFSLFSFLIWYAVDRIERRRRMGTRDAKVIILRTYEALEVSSELRKLCSSSIWDDKASIWG